MSEDHFILSAFREQQENIRSIPILERAIFVVESCVLEKKEEQSEIDQNRLIELNLYLSGVKLEPPEVTDSSIIYFKAVYDDFRFKYIK